MSVRNLATSSRLCPTQCRHCNADEPVDWSCPGSWCHYSTR